MMKFIRFVAVSLILFFAGQSIHAQRDDLVVAVRYLF